MSVRRGVHRSRIQPVREAVQNHVHKRAQLQMVLVSIPGQHVHTQIRVMVNIRPRVVRPPGNHVRDVRRGDVPLMVPVPVVQSAVLHVITGTINQAIHA